MTQQRWKKIPDLPIRKLDEYENSTDDTLKASVHSGTETGAVEANQTQKWFLFAAILLIASLLFLLLLVLFFAAFFFSSNQESNDQNKKQQQSNSPPGKMTGGDNENDGGQGANGNDSDGKDSGGKDSGGKDSNPKGSGGQGSDSQSGNGSNSSNDSPPNGSNGNRGQGANGNSGGKGGSAGQNSNDGSSKRGDSHRRGTHNGVNGSSNGPGGNSERKDQDIREQPVPKDLKITTFFKAEAKSLRVTYVIDCSDKMSFDAFSRIKTELRKSIESLDSRCYFSVIFYSQDKSLVFNDQHELVKANDQNKIKVARWIRKQNKSSGPTAKLPDKEIRQLGADVVFVTSALDIEPSDIANQTSTKFHTFAVGQSRQTPNLKALSDRSNGKHYPHPLKRD